MEISLTYRYLLALFYAVMNASVVGRVVDSFQDKRYGWFGFFTSFAILNVFMMARAMFCEI